MTEELDKYVREHTSTEGDYLYRLVDEEETGCCQVAELTGSLNHDIDARTAQLLGWDRVRPFFG